LTKLWQQNEFVTLHNLTVVEGWNTIVSCLGTETSSVPKGLLTISKQGKSPLCTKCQATPLHLELVCNIIYKLFPLQLWELLVCSKYRMR